MALGFVLVALEAGRESEAYERLLHEDMVKEVHPLFGDFELIVKVEASDFDKLGEVIVDRIRTIPGVRATETLTTTRF